MKLVILILCQLLILSCNQSSIRQDTGMAPAKLNQYRLPMTIDNQTEVGIISTLTTDKQLKIPVYGSSGQWSIRGESPCGFYYGEDYKDKKEITFDLDNFETEMPVCLYAVTVNPNGFDDILQGMLIVRKFVSENIIPLTIESDRIKREGVNYLQVQESPLILGGINESHIIRLYPKNKHGTVFIHSDISGDLYDFDCTASTVCVIEYNISKLYQTEKKIDKPQVFTISVNPDTSPEREMALLYVNVYKQPGRFLAAPIVREEANQTCVEFTDKNIIALSVNQKQSKLGELSLCLGKDSSNLEYFVDDKNTIIKGYRYLVQAITSKGALFYGEYKNKKWSLK